jgi:NCS2 family nucleobase:cation symporter-2
MEMDRPVKPSNLIFGLDDRPPMGTLLLLGLEHAFLLIASLVATIFFAKAVGASLTETQSLVNVGLFAGGITCILQAWGKHGVGSGYFCLHTSSFVYFHSSVFAFKTGGFPMVYGMTAVAGLLEAALAPFMRRLRAFFPPEVSGLVVAAVGIALAPYAMRSLVGITDTGSVVKLPEVFVGCGTLAVIIGLNVWGTKTLRLYAVLIGILTGYGLAFAVGILSMETLKGLNQLPLIGFPRFVHAGLSFRISLLFPFAVAAVCVTLKLIGDLTTCQKINDSNWKRVDIDSISRGLVAEGVGTAITGLLGGTGLAASSSNIGMSYATGATSKIIGTVTGAMFMALAFLPKVASLLALMPRPVVGAIVIYAACFMIVTGWSIIMTRMIDARKTFTVGLALVAGISVETIPQLFGKIPAELKPIFGSSLALAALVAVIINMVFRIGIRSKMTLHLPAEHDADQKIYRFFENAGETWGARREVVMCAMSAVNEFLETAVALELASGPICVEAGFDEFSLEVEIRYPGRPMVFPMDRPSADAILDDEAGLAKLSGYIIRQSAQKLRSETRNGEQRIMLHYDH